MSVETRPVPCNILAWPKIRDLITQHKFIYCYLYFCPDANACGCYLFSLERSAADLSMTTNSLKDAIDEFVRRDLIWIDRDTGEIWITAWPRWHQYKSPPARGALWAAIEKIQSHKLWTTIKKAYESIPQPGKDKEKEKEKAKASSKEEEAPSANSESLVVQDTKNQPSHFSRSPAGITCWNIEDRIAATELEQKYGLETVTAVVEMLKVEKVSVLPSHVTARLTKQGPSLESQWWTTDSGTDLAATTLGIIPSPGEAYAQLRERIRRRLKELNLGNK